MIGISTTTGNTAGAIVIHERPASDTKNYPTRLQRSATLDGGAVITHLGYSDGDRILRILMELSKAEADKLLNIEQTETVINVSLPDGFFSGAIEDLNIPGGVADMTILLESKLSA